MAGDSMGETQYEKAAGQTGEQSMRKKELRYYCSPRRKNGIKDLIIPRELYISDLETRNTRDTGR
jgi:hypothetical protein